MTDRPLSPAMHKERWKCLSKMAVTCDVNQNGWNISHKILNIRFLEGPITPGM